MRNKTSYKWKVFAVFLIIFVLLLFNGLFILTFSTNGACNLGLEWKRHPTTHTRDGQSADAKITNLWNMKIATEDMEIHGETLIATDRHCNEVVAFDLRSGQTIWTQGFGGPQKLTLNTYRNQIYVTGGWSWQRELMAVDLNTGRKKWLNNSQNFKRTGLDAATLSDGRVLIYIGDQGPRLVDPDTGKFSDIIAVPFSSSFRRSGNFMWTWDGSRLQAVGIIDQQTVWSSAQIELPNSRLSNISHNPDIVVAQFTTKTDDSSRTSSQKLMGFSYNDDGTLLWEISNLTPEFKLEVDRERLYVFDGSSFRVLNSINGDEVERIVFTSGETGESSELGNTFFRVQGNIVAIYFADTEILSIYEIQKVS